MAGQAATASQREENFMRQPANHQPVTHTVRHHIRAIYAKPGSKGKDGIVHPIHQQAPFG
jgi:hypothetical protein